MRKTCRMLVMVFVSWLTVAGPCSANPAVFSAQMDSVAKNMVQLLQIPAKGSFSFSATEKDENYLLPVTSLYDLLAKRIRRHNKRFLINVLDGENQRLVQSLYVKASAGGYEDIEIREARVDSLIVGTSLYLSSSGKLYARFVVCDLGSQVRFQSEKLRVPRKGPEAEFLEDLFDIIDDGEGVEMLRFREAAIQKLSSNLMADPNMTSSQNIFAFKKDWTYANFEQVDAIEQILRVKFGFRFDPGSRDRITVNRAGGLEFRKRGKKLEIPRMIDVEPILGDDFKPEADSLIVPADEMATTFAKIPITRQDDRDVFDRIRETIENQLASAYNRMDFGYLSKVFADNQRSILRGKVSSNPKAGREKVRYYWDSKQKYLNGLKRLVGKKGYRLDVALKLMGIYQEDANRYWAVVYQKWKTKKKNGKVVYRDDGFLFINFDFADNRNKPVFKIYYRIWIYNYKFGNPETGFTRADFIQRDFDGVFFPAKAKGIGGKGFYTSKGKRVRDPGSVTIRGIDRNILKIIRDDLIRAIRQQDHLIRAR